MVARMMIAVRSAPSIHRQIDEYGFIRLFIPRVPSTPFLMAYRKKLEKGVILFELVSIEYQGDQKVRYYYAELKHFRFVLNEMQKKSIAWLLSELNECVVVQLRTQGWELRLPTAQAVPDTYASSLVPENGITDPDVFSRLQYLISLLKVVFPVRPNQKTQWKTVLYTVHALFGTHYTSLSSSGLHFTSQINTSTITSKSDKVCCRSLHIHIFTHNIH